MRVLLDTCVVSELQRRDAHPNVRKAVEMIPDEQLFLCVLTVGEIVRGVEQLPGGKRRQVLEQWLLELERHFSQRILPIDLETGRIWGEITARARREGITIPAVDGLLAATALRHGLHLMTRNTRDFQATGVSLLNPWVD